MCLHNELLPVEVSDVLQYGGVHFSSGLSSDAEFTSRIIKLQEKGNIRRDKVILHTYMHIHVHDHTMNVHVHVGNEKLTCTYTCICMNVCMHIHDASITIVVQTEVGTYAALQ